MIRLPRREGCSGAAQSRRQAYRLRYVPWPMLCLLRACFAGGCDPRPFIPPPQHSSVDRRVWCRSPNVRGVFSFARGLAASRFLLRCRYVISKLFSSFLPYPFARALLFVAFLPRSVAPSPEGAGLWIQVSSGLALCLLSLPHFAGHSFRLFPCRKNFCVRARSGGTSTRVRPFSQNSVGTPGRRMKGGKSGSATRGFADHCCEGRSLAPRTSF